MNISTKLTKTENKTKKFYKNFTSGNKCVYFYVTYKTVKQI